VPHFGAILPNGVAIEQIVQKLLCFDAKNVGEIAPLATLQGYIQIH
jgi:hypothetical protein